MGTNGIQDQKSFGLNNSGDDVYLFQGNDIVDAVCYGNVLIEDSKLWADDEPFSDKTNSFFQRHGTVDTDTSADWHNYGATYYEFDPDYKMDATVTPFLFPDDGGIPVYDAQVLSLFIVAVAAAEVAIGLALIVAMFRARKSVETTSLNTLKD